MYGYIAKINAKPGERDALLAILLEGSTGMAGCIGYVVAEDQDNMDAVWVTEVWESEAAHAASLQLPSVKAAIAKAMPLIAGFEPLAQTTPRGGIGLPVVGR